jgi:uncharacterized protein (UPF0332 family)
MTPETAELVRYRLARATESLAEAKLLLTNDHVRTAVNRLYYACFYAVSALLLTEGHSSPKHSGIRALFDQHWIASGRLPKDMGRLYRRLFDSRQQGDYADLVTFDPAEVRLWLEDAGAFVERIVRLLKGCLEGNQGKVAG